MSESRPIPRNRRKTRSGCLQCKQRKIKCDESLPQCNQCARRALDCPGYVRPLKWSSKYETWNSTAASQETARNVSRSMRRITNSAKESENVLSQTSRSLTDSGELSSAEKELVSKADHQKQTTNSALIEDFNLDSDRLLGPLLFSRPSIDDFFFETVTQGPSIDTAILWNDLPVVSPQIIEDQSTRLSRHYFSSICRMNCCFDSSKNPFRVWVAESMRSCPPLYHCILSMSASHLAARQQDDLVPVALELRAEAISGLGSEILGGDLQSSLKACSSYEGLSRALLACILLGMTDGWRNPSFLGITHLHGARVLFKKWLAGITDSTSIPSADKQKIANIKSFLVGTMAYWEAMASFLMDQPIQSISYLTPICDQTGDGKIQSNPWTGISTPLFVYLAQAGTLGRQRSMIRKLTASTSTSEIQEMLHEELLAQARGVERAVLTYKFPPGDRIEETGDALTPISHLQKMAQVYKLTALLEIYRVFPELCQGQSSSDESFLFDSMTFESRILTIATSILTMISTIPVTSGVNALICLPMITAGSALQSAGSNQPEHSKGSTWISLCKEMMSTFVQDDGHARWREFVRERMSAIHNHVGLGAVARALEVIEKTWLRADIQAFANEPSSLGGFVHWTDVMTEEQLETIFG